MVVCNTHNSRDLQYTHSLMCICGSCVLCQLSRRVKCISILVARFTPLMSLDLWYAWSCIPYIYIYINNSYFYSEYITLLCYGSVICKIVFAFWMTTIYILSKHTATSPLTAVLYSYNAWRGNVNFMNFITVLKQSTKLSIGNVLIIVCIWRY